MQRGLDILPGKPTKLALHHVKRAHQQQQPEAGRAETLEQGKRALSRHAGALSARASAVSIRLMVPATP